MGKPKFRPHVNLKPLKMETKIGLSDYVIVPYNHANFRGNRFKGACSWIYQNGHNFAAALPIDVMFGSVVDFSRMADSTVQFAFKTIDVIHKYFIQLIALVVYLLEKQVYDSLFLLFFKRCCLQLLSSNAYRL